MEQWQIDRAARNAREAAELERSIKASAERLAEWSGLYDADVEQDTDGRRYKVMGKFILRGQTAHFLIAQLEPLDDDII